MKTIAGVAILGGALIACSAPQTDVTDQKESTTEAKLEVFATGAKFAGTNGIHFGPDGMLYITSVLGSDISVMDPNSGEIVKRFTADDGVIAPDDIAFASDGSFYWSSILTGEVAGFSTDGEKIIAAQIAPGANPITFSDDDRLFVAQCFLGHNLYEIDPSGANDARLIADGLGPNCGLNGMDWGEDDRLYGPKWFTGDVLSVDVDTGERRVEASGFQTPAAIKFNSKNELHVLDTGSGELIRVINGVKEVVASFTPGLDNFAFDANDTPFVSSFTDGFIKRVNDDGSITELSPGGMSHPSGVAVIGDTVWVGDLQALRGYNRNTGEEISTIRNIVGVGDLGGSFSVSADGDTLILTSWFDGDVRVWDTQQHARIAHYQVPAGPISAVRYAGGLAIAEHGTGSVKLYGEGEPTVLATNLPAPTALVVDGEDLLVSDRALGEIRTVARGGVALAEPEIIGSDLGAPEGFLRANGGFVVVEADASQVVFVSEAGDRRVLGSFPAGSGALPGFPPSYIFNGIAADADGNLFVTGEKDRVLYRIEAPW